MAISTYAELQAAVRDWLNREDPSVVSRTIDFITFAENRIFRQLRSRFNETQVTYSAQTFDNTQKIALPADFKEVKLITYDDRALQRRSEQWVLSQDPLAASGIPLYFYRVGAELFFWRIAAENSDVTMIYYQKQTLTDQATPLVFTQFPELYLFGALLEAKPYLKATDSNDIALWQTKYDQTFNDIMDDSWEAEYAGSTVAVSGGVELDRNYNRTGVRNY